MAEEIISRAEARARGLTQYFTGKPCKHGHIAARTVANGVCRTCFSEIEKRYKANNPEKIRDKLRRQAARHRRDNPERVNRNKKKWSDANREYENARIALWKRANPEKVREYDKRSYDRNHEKRIAKNRRWHAANRDNPEHKKKVLDRMRQWELANPDRAKENRRKVRHTRRARMYEAGGSYTNEEIRQLIEDQNWLCAEPTCCVSLRDAKELDHIIPISKRGPNHIRNLQYLCVPCNRSKRDKHPIEWARERGRELTPKEILIMEEEYPKYVEVHPSHIDRTNGHISTPLFPQYHVDRNQKVTVLVHDAAEEALATSGEHKEEA